MKQLLTLAAAAAATAAVGIAASAYADVLAPVAVSPLPTSVTVSTAGKTYTQVHREVVAAAGAVCANAQARGDLGLYGDDWCPIRATQAAMTQYRELLGGPGAVAVINVVPGGRPG